MNLTSVNKHLPEQAGFTLLEMLIVIMVMVFISIGIYQITTGTFQLRDRLGKEGEFYSSIKLALNIVQRDIQMMYSPIIMVPLPSASSSPTPGTAQAPIAPVATSPEANDTTIPSQFWEPAIDSSGLRPSRFTGVEKKISFISSSHQRIYKDTPESTFSKIIYELKPDDTPDAIPSTFILTKEENVDVFGPDGKLEDDKQNGFYQSFSLLHGVKSLKFRFYQADHGAGEHWITDWDTDRPEYQNAFPDFIEMTIQILGPNNLSFDGVFNIRPEIPIRGINPSS